MKKTVIQDEQEVRIPFTVSETAANTYTEVAVTMPVEPASNLVFDLDQIEYNMNRPDLSANGLGGIQIQFTRSTQTDIISVNNTDFIAGVTRHATNASATAARYTFFSDEKLGMTTPNLANYIANRQIHVGIKGDSNGSTKAVSGFLIGRLKRVSDKVLQGLILNLTQ